MSTFEGRFSQANPVTPLRHKPRWLAILSCLLLASLWSGVARAELKPATNCLPDETVLLTRATDLKAFVTAMQERTKLGKVLLNQQRLTEAFEKVRGLDRDAWEEASKKLEAYNIKLDDVAAAFDGEFGYAIALVSREGKQPMPIGIFWVEPEKDLSGRLMAAYEKFLTEQLTSLDDDAKDRFQRVDLELAGERVIQVSNRMWRLEYGEIDFSNIDFNDPDAVQRRFEEQQKNAKRTETDRSHLLVTKFENRLIFVHNFPGTIDSAAREAAGDNPDFDSLTGLEEIKGLLARFLAAHSSDHVAQLSFLNSPGMTEALPSGLPMLEIFFDPTPLIALNKTEENAAQVTRVMQVVGIDRLGPLAMKVALDENVLRSVLWASLPAPRSGFMKLLDQPAIACEPPAWVPATVLQYQQLSFDLGKAYAHIKELSLAEWGEEAQNAFDTMETQANALLQTDVTTLLSSLGTRHYTVSFEPAPAAADEDPLEALTTGRMALIWQTGDESLWKKILNMAAPLLGQQVADEQGFAGLRIPEGSGIEGGLFVGQGNLVMGLGDKIVEQTLAALRSPPDGAAALRNSELFQRSQALLPSQPAIAFTYADNDRNLRLIRAAFVAGFEKGFAQATTFGDEEAAMGGNQLKAQYDLFQSLIPTEEELKGVVGPGITQWLMTDQGALIRSAIELPAP